MMEVMIRQGEGIGRKYLDLIKIFFKHLFPIIRLEGLKLHIIVNQFYITYKVKFSIVKYFLYTRFSKKVPAKDVLLINIGLDLI